MENYLSVITTLIAIFIAWIAYNQYAIAKTKLRLELFEKRYNVHEAVRIFLGSVLREARVDGEEMYKFLEGTATAKFLFGPEVKLYIDEIYKNSIDQNMWRQIRTSDVDRDKKLEAIAKESEKIKWLHDQISELNGIFGKYLKIDRP